MNAVIGIDPGLSGALAVVNMDGAPDVLAVFDLPVVARATGKGNQLDAHGLCRIVLEVIRDHGRVGHAYVEAQRPMAKQGVTSMFSLGRTIGAIEGVIAACGLPMTLVEPQRWKRAAGLIKVDKDQSRTRALQVFPSQAGNLVRVKDHGRAEAMLIAWYGHRLAMGAAEGAERAAA